MQKKEKVNLVAVGLFLFIGLVLLTVGIYFAGKYAVVIKGGTLLNVRFDNLADLNTGAKVRVAGGFNIGHVQEIKLEGSQMVVVLAIDKEYDINRGANFYIHSTGLVGMKYIDVMGYDPGEGEFYEHNEYIEGISPVAMEEIFDEILGVVEIFTTDEGMQGFGETFDSLGEIINNLNSLLGDGGISSVMYRLNSTLADTEVLVNDMRETVSNLTEISANLSSQIASIEEGDVGQIVANIDTISAELSELAAKLNSDDSTLSLLTDPEFSESLQTTLENLEAFSEILKEKPNSIVFGYKD